MRIWKTLAVLALGCVLVLWALNAFVNKPPLPRLVDNTTGDFYGDDPEFQRRVTAAYPSPVSLDVLTIYLTDQGFQIDPSLADGRIAILERGDFPCRYTWAISWQIEGDNASRING